jgi:hypothetical protein
MFTQTLYIQVFADHFVMRHLESGQTNILTPTKPYSSQRLLIGDFAQAETTLQKGIKTLFDGRFTLVRPIILFHPKDKVEGGLSQVEENIFKELGMAAGARRSVIWLGKDLSDTEVAAKIAEDRG